MRTLLGGLVALVVAAACATSAPSSAPVSAPVSASFGTCEDAFRAWVANAESLNSPDVDLTGQLLNGEQIQHGVFALCRLDEAERLNHEILLRDPSGGGRPMIEPDFRTFAEVECVDESPLFDDTAVCAEVGR
jgi:hypothetical protein